MNDAYKLLLGLEMSDRNAVELLPFVTTMQLRVNETIWRKGELEQPWTHIVSGLVCASLPDAGNELAAVNVYGPGSWIGEGWLVAGLPSAFEHVCVAPTQVLQVPNDRVREVFESDPGFSRFMARLVTWRSQHHAERLSLMGNGSLPLRVVLGLALLAEALQSGASHQSAPQPPESLLIPLTQTQLAGILRISRGVFSSCVQQLATIGWARVTYSSVQLLNLDKWRAFSNSLRKSRSGLVKPSMDELLAVLLDGPTKALAGRYLAALGSPTQHEASEPSLLK